MLVMCDASDIVYCGIRQKKAIPVLALQYTLHSIGAMTTLAHRHSETERQRDKIAMAQLIQHNQHNQHNRHNQYNHTHYVHPRDVLTQHRGVCRTFNPHAHFTDEYYIDYQINNCTNYYCYQWCHTIFSSEKGSLDDYGWESCMLCVCYMFVFKRKRGDGIRQYVGWLYAMQVKL